MFKRDLNKAYAENAYIYEQITKEAEESLLEHVDSLTVFHKILLDKVADSYIATLPKSAKDAVDARTAKAAADYLQKWLSIAFNEVRIAKADRQARQVFYEKVLLVLDDVILDNALRREVIREIHKVVNE